MSTKSKQRKGIPGLIVTVMTLVLVLEFIGVMMMTKLLPGFLLMIIGILMGMVVILVAALTSDFRKKAIFTLGTALAILMMILILIGNFYVLHTYNTLSRISGVNTATSQIGVYVKTEDPAQNIEDTKGYRFGVLSNLDQENTAYAREQIQDILGEEIQIVEMDSVFKLVDGLLEGDYEAMILNHAYIAVIEEMEEYQSINEQIRELQLLEIETAIQEAEEVIEDKEHIIQLFISGIDTRGSRIINTRSDVNIIATINSKTHQILLLSTPRDYFVPLSISNGEKDKLTHAGIYGVNVSMDTLGMLYDIDLKKYFRVNFSGFIDIIDSLGGIDVYSEYDFSLGNYHYSEGMNHMGGEMALAFARERYSFQAGDRQRGSHQMAVIEAVIKKVLSPELLSKYTDLLSAVEGSFETNVDYRTIADFVRRQLEENASWEIIQMSVDGTGGNERPYSMSANAYVMHPNQETVDAAKEALKKIYNDEVLVK